MSHYMNPFDFVPLPDKPKEMPEAIKDEQRYEGYIEFSVIPLTPIHISGTTESNNANNDEHLHYNLDFACLTHRVEDLKSMILAEIP